MKISHLIACLIAVAAPSAATAQATTHGIVFVDKNGDGIHQPNEPGLAGVAVSNQDAVVVTDKAGGFDIGPGPNGLIFVSEPDGYRSVGSFWQILDTSGNTM